MRPVNITQNPASRSRAWSAIPHTVEDPNAKEYYEVSRRIMAQEKCYYGFDDNGHYTVVPFGLRSFTTIFLPSRIISSAWIPTCLLGTEVRFKNAEPGFLMTSEILSYA